MQTFGFKNFRKFRDFPMIDLGGINILVGTNNSGKSSAIKAIDLFTNNIFSRISLAIDQPDGFMSPRIESYAIGIKDSDLNNNDTKEMEFSLSVGETLFTYTIFEFAGDWKSYKLRIERENILYLYNLEEGTLYCRIYFDSIEDKLHVLDSIRLQLHTIHSKFESAKEAYTISGKREDKRSQSLWERRYADFNKVVTKNDDCDNYVEIEVKLLDIYTIDEYGIVTTNDYLRSLLGKYNTKILRDLTGLQPVTIVSAHGISHSRFIMKEDSNDFLDTLYEFYINNGNSNRFVKKWIKELGIGDALEIRDIDELHEVFTLDIIREGKKIPLGNMGTGTIQLIQLLIFFSNYTATHGGGNMLIIEEPEQNLHPALQSKLADLLYYMYLTTNESGFPVQIVVETHSEYLVRRLQVIVAERIKSGVTVDKINEDFKVYYFPEDGTPYSMDFQPNGCFEESFGPGFFDEAGNSYRALFKLERGL